MYVKVTVGNIRSLAAHTLEVSRLDLTSVPVSELSKLPARLTRLAANYCGLTVEATTALLTAVTRTSSTTTQLGLIRWISRGQEKSTDIRISFSYLLYSY